MNETDKELRLSLIQSWKQAHLLNRSELETVLMDIEVTKHRAAALEIRRQLLCARLDLSAFALERLGVKNP